MKYKFRTYLMKPIGFLLLFSFCFTIIFPSIFVPAASGIKLYNYTTGKTSTYTGKQVKYVCNGVPVSLPGTPGIIVDGVALGPYEDIFQNTYGMDCSLSKNGEKLTITYHGNELVLTLGSKKAVLNGKTQTMTVAPTKIKYTANGITKYLVPTRFVAESMGIRYSWTSGLSTASMTRSITLNYGGKDISYSGLFCRASYNGTVFESFTAPNIILSNTAMVHGEEFFGEIVGLDYFYNEEDETIILSKGNISLEMILGSTVVYVNGETADCGVAPELIYYKDTDEYAVLLPAYFVANVFGYEYEWDGTTKTAIILPTQYTQDSDEIFIPEESGEITDSDEVLETNGSSLAEEFFSWTPSVSKEVPTITQNSIKVGENPDFTYLNTIFKDELASDYEKETYYISFTEPIYQVENLGVDENNELILQFPNIVSPTRFYNLNGTLMTYISTGNIEESTAQVKFQLSSDRLTYDLKISDDHLSLILTIYNNELNKISSGRLDNGDIYITFEGYFPIDAEIINLDNIIMVEFPYMVNLLSNTDYYFEEGKEISSAILSSPQLNYCQFVVNKNDSDLILTTETSNNTFTLLLSKKSSEDSSDSFEDLQPTPNPVIPDITPDISQFESSERYLSIDIPQEVAVQEILDEDRYYNRQIVLTLPGDHSSFYEEHPIRNTCDIVSSIDISVDDWSTIITITTDKVQAYFLEYGEGYIHLIMDTPSKFYNKIVVLDAGHGGSDPGAVKNGVNEKDLNFKILNQYTAEYFKNSDIKIYFTRTTDILVDLYDRADYSTEIDADLFVSLHMNSSTSSLSNGTGVYYSTLNPSINEGGLTSKKMAGIFVNGLSSALNTKNNGPLSANFVVIRETKVPAVLIELGFLTNTNDFKKLTNETYQKKAAKTIYNIIVELFETYPTSRSN